MQKKTVKQNLLIDSGTNYLAYCQRSTRHMAQAKCTLARINFIASTRLLDIWGAIRLWHDLAGLFGTNFHEKCGFTDRIGTNVSVVGACYRTVRICNEVSVLYRLRSIVAGIGLRYTSRFFIQSGQPAPVVIARPEMAIDRAGCHAKVEKGFSATFTPGRW